MGSHSNQSFQKGYIGDLSPTITELVFRLRGVKPDHYVEKTRKVCTLCGRRYEASDMFCSHDGNALIIEA